MTPDHFYLFGALDWNGIWTTTTAIATSVGAVATCFAAIAIFIARKQLEFEAWLKAQSIWTDKEFTKNRAKLFERLERPGQSWSTEEKQQGLELCRRMDEFATLAPFLKRSKVLETWADPIAKAWIVLSPLVQEERRVCQWDEKWKAFPKLGEESCRFRCRAQPQRKLWVITNVPDVPSESSPDLTHQRTV